MKRFLFLILMFTLLIMSLFPLITMFYTAIIPEGNLTHVIKEKYLNDFEIKYIRYIKRKVKTYDGAKISISKDSPETKQSLKIDLEPDKTQRIALLTNDLDLRMMKNLSFFIKSDIKDFNIIFYDVDENQTK
ncbi:hypothetical protein [Marinitoga lauensis]|nr:hypothetical protein [Marinitoga lauensis]